VAADTRLGPYRILRLINRGGQGSVFLGYDGRLGRRVAIKTYRLPDQRNSRRRCLKEARLIASMQSPRVVQIHDIFESREHLALVMEYVPGCDLEEFLGAVSPSLASVLTLASDIAGALVALRQRRIVHGDIKASNVLITDSGRVKLTDFGIARRAGSSGAGPGSLTAVSPEQYLGHPMDVRSDLFVLGCLLYRMLSGREPFWREGRLDPKLLLESAPPPLQSLTTTALELPEELIRLVDQLLQKNPASRPASIHEVRVALREAASRLPQAAHINLLAEASPCFRQESEEDIPPRLPADLAREGRFRLEYSSTGNWWQWMRRPRNLLRGTLLGLLVAGLAAYFLSRPLPLYVEQPLMELQAGFNLPQEVTADWLVASTLQAVEGRFGRLRPTGPGVGAGQSIYYSPSAARSQPAPRKERLSVELRCRPGMCIYGVNWQRGERQDYRQAILLPDMPLRRWRQLIGNTVASLQPGSGL
jgi:tRNA A-37 threonylcarbamoyl transferase component Bud32